MKKERLTIKQQLQILTNDDRQFSKTKKMLKPHILCVIKRAKLDEVQGLYAYDKLINLVPEVAMLYLTNWVTTNKEYDFTTYFSWYISEVVNPLVEEK